MRRLTLAALTALVLAPGATGGNYVALPSPLAQLSPAPPIGGGATATSETIRHRIAATTVVGVSLDPGGAPFAVNATQRLDVRVVGDYFFTIGAPLLDVVAAPGSESTPGLRATSILWTGFNPGRRTLIARATLDPAVAAGSLPLRVEAGAGRVTLVNITGVMAGSYTADALVPPLLDYLAQLRRDVAQGRAPTSGGATVTSTPVAAGLRVVAPLHVRGTIGGRTIDAVLAGRLSIAGGGPIRLSVTPASPEGLLGAPTAGLSGRRLLDRVTRTTLTLARVRQYEMFLGNPDPTGTNQTTYVYRTAARPTPAAAAVVHVSERDWATTFAVGAGLLLAAGAAAVVWARS
jgi:hypothetical protein